MRRALAICLVSTEGLTLQVIMPFPSTPIPLPFFEMPMCIIHNCSAVRLFLMIPLSISEALDQALNFLPTPHH